MFFEERERFSEKKEFCRTLRKDSADFLKPPNVSKVSKKG
jgi:hypothetical protein